MRSHWHVGYGCHLNVLYLYPERKTHSVGRRSMVLLFPSISSHEAGIVSQSPMTRYPMPEVQSSTHSGFNTDYGSSEPLKTLVMFCIMLCNSWSLGPVTDNTASDSIGSRTPNAVSSYPLTSDSTSVSYLALFSFSSSASCSKPATSRFITRPGNAIATVSQKRS